MACNSSALLVNKSEVLDSVKKRYLITLLSNAVLSFAGFVTAGIVPRALGPKQLGDFSFLNRVSCAFRSILDMGTSGAFFNYNSKHRKTGPLVKIYSLWLLGQLFVVICLIALAAFMGFSGLIWPGQQTKFIVWVAIFEWSFFLSAVLKQLSDSKGYTAKAQMINLVLGLFNIVILVFFAVTGLLNLGRYIAIQTFCCACVALGIIFWIIIPHKELFWEGLMRGQFRDLRKYFYNFCSPLVIVVIVSFIFEYFDRLILQRFSGSVEQGYFHIASSWSALSTFFTASMLSIYKREIAYSLGQQDYLRATAVFSRYIKMLYFITLVLAMFLAFHAKTLLALIAGPKFEAAGLVMSIMAFYPIHQVYGQLGGAAFYSTENTRLLRNISVIAMLIGIPLSYLFLAPPHSKIPGLGMGSMGLALKTVIWNLVVVQVYLVYNCKYFKISPWHFWWHQIYSFIIIGSVMLLVKWLVNYFVNSQGMHFIILGTETLIYFSLVACIAYVSPRIAGISRDDVVFITKKMKSVCFSFGS